MAKIVTHECPRCHCQAECPNPEACGALDSHGLLDVYHYLCDACCTAISVEDAAFHSNRGGL